MSFLVEVFWKLLTPKEAFSYMSERSCFRTFFGNQHVHGFQTLQTSARHHYYPIVPWIWDKLSWKKFVLVRSEILRLFVNTLTTDYKFSSHNLHNFTQQFQTPLSQKQKTFSQFCFPFLQSTWNLEHFERKDESPGLIIFEIIDFERGDYLNV